MKTTSIHPTTESAVKHDRGQSRAWLGYAQSAVCCYMNTTYISFILKKTCEKVPGARFSWLQPTCFGWLQLTFSQLELGKQWM